MKETYYGELTYKRKKYSFSFFNNELTLIPKKMEMQSFERWFLDNEKQNMCNIEGTTADGCYMIFINVIVRRDISGYYKAFVPIYAICRQFGLYPKLDKIEKMSFAGTALDLLFPPKKIIDQKTLDNKFIIEIDRNKHLSQKIELNKDIMELYISWKTNNVSSINEVLTVKSGMNIIFDKPQSLKSIVKYYKNIRKLFSFLNNRKHINWNEVKLIKNIENNERKKVMAIFEFYVANNDKIEVDMPESFNSITYDNIKAKLPYLYKISSDKEFNINFLPNNIQESNIIDDEKYMSLAENFEFQFSKLFPSFKSNNNEIFRNTKLKILNFIESNIDSKEYDSKKEKEKNEKYYKHFKKIIEDDEGRLEEKISFVFKKYNQILTTKRNILCRYYDTDMKEEGLAEQFSKRRNKIAHGEYTGAYNDNEIVSFLLLRMCLYCIILERSKFSEEEIKKFINKMF